VNEAPGTSTGPGSGQQGETAAQQPGRPRASLWSTLRQFPAVTSLLVITAMFYLLQVLSSLLLGFDIVLAFGAKARELTAAGQLWRIITPIFVHGGLWHLGVNMYSLYALGFAVEKFFGSRRMLVIYLLSGICGVATSQAFSAHPSVGASGAIFGLLGAMVAFLYMHRRLFGQTGWRQFGSLVLVAVLNLLMGLMPGVDNLAHVGGLVGGLVLTVTLGPHLETFWVGQERVQLVDRRGWKQVRWGLLLAGILILALAVLTAFSTLGS
jgi:rhomboid protease GluP